MAKEAALLAELNMLYSEIEDKIENASDVDILKEQLQQAEKNIKMQE